MRARRAMLLRSAACAKSIHMRAMRRYDMFTPRRHAEIDALRVYAGARDAAAHTTLLLLQRAMS